MAPQSVIGAAAPIMMSPGGRRRGKDARHRRSQNDFRRPRPGADVQAEKNGHNIDVIEAMIDKTKAFEIDGEVLNKEGNILTLTDRQAAKEYGSPAQAPALCRHGRIVGCVARKTWLCERHRIDIQPTAPKNSARGSTKSARILLIIGIIGLYIEFKTPGFGLPGIVGIAAFAIYFLGGYVAGLSGAGWILVFILGLALIALELFVFPGTFIAGLTGAVLILVALVMGMVDVYPGTPSLPSLPQLQLPLRDLSIAMLVSVVLALMLARFLPKTTLFNQLVSQGASGEISVAAVEAHHSARLGKIGVAIAPLCPGGKARFDDELLDVITRGEMVPKGQRVKIIGHTGPNAIVEAVS
jgi:membrane-bound serine protease (ClpP class)